MKGNKIFINTNKVRSHMRKNLSECRDPVTGEVNSTLLAEMTAAELSLYEGLEEEIPEVVFEIASEFS
jgi:hypothetical protein